jgi:hypothetical protein
MSIKKYTNFEKINQKTDNEGKFIQDKDLFIVSKSEIEDSDFGDCKHDVMEVSVYDINNNLLPQKSGENVAYIKSGTIKEYVYNVTNTRGKKELAIDVEKLLSDLGFSNGILRVNFNFIRNRVGNENVIRRAWIQEISATRNEIRVVPLKTKNEFINAENEKDLDNLSNLNKDFKYYRKSVLDSLYSFEGIFMDKITGYLESKYGKDYFALLRKDFGLRDFDKLATIIYEQFRESVNYYLTNRNYDITSTAYGLQSGIRFEDCEQYDFEPMINEMEIILRKVIEINTTFLKRRDFKVEETPTEFKAAEQIKEIQNNLDSFQTAQVTVSTTFPTILPSPTPMPPQVTVPSRSGFYYTLKNNKTTGAIIFTFMDINGQRVEKKIAPGQSFTVCAMEGTVSTTANLSNMSVIDDGSLTASDFGSGLIAKRDWNIIKGKVCNTVDISNTAPSPVPELIPLGTTEPVKTSAAAPIIEYQTVNSTSPTSQVVSSETNQINTSIGMTTISTATTVNQSEGVQIGNVTTTKTDVRQTTLSSA